MPGAAVEEFRGHVLPAPGKSQHPALRFVHRRREGIQMTRDWVIVADSTVARIYEQRGGGELRSVREFRNPAAHAHPRDLGSDRPGRRVDSFGHRHALGSERDDATKHALAEWVGEIAQELDRARSAGGFATLTLVVPPRLLGALRAALSPACQACVTRIVRKDLVHSTEAELQAHLA
jgi:protein required for attachment to host cells